MVGREGVAATAPAAPRMLPPGAAPPTPRPLLLLLLLLLVWFTRLWATALPVVGSEGWGKAGKERGRGGEGEIGERRATNFLAE